MIYFECIACTFVEVWEKVAMKMTLRLGQGGEDREDFANDRPRPEDKGLGRWGQL